MNKKRVLAVDIGGTNTLVAVVDEEFKIIDKTEFETSRQIAEVISRVASEADKFDPKRDLPVGIAICGLLSIDGEKLLLAPNLGWKNIDIHEAFSPLKREYIVVNDATAAGWASYVTERTDNVRRLLAVTLGTGVGGGLVLDGNLLIGAGELGHIKVDINGPRCNCGKAGCLEALIGGTHMPKRAKEWFGLDVKTPKDLFDLAAQGNEKAVEFWKKFGGILGYALSSVVNLNGVQVIAIGGKICDAEEYFLKDLQASLSKSLMIQEYQSCKIIISKWRHNYSLMGAASLVIDPPKKLFE